MTVIGLTGWGGSGKSTAAEMLVEDHGFTRVSFAGPLKRMVFTLDPIITDDGQRLSQIWELHQGDERHIKTWYPEYQRILRTLGTECVRAEDEDFWVRAMGNRLEADVDYVIDDVRLPNEAALVKTLNPDGLWNIYRPDMEAPSDHLSEQLAGKLGETLWISNDGTLGKLQYSIEMALQEMRTSA